jgi:hypothetical protein
VTEDERIEEKQAPEEPEDVEAHGAKHVVAAGLAGAALIGAGAAGVKLATDDNQSRNQGALVSPEESESLAQADGDNDGYVNYRDLAHEGWKYSVEELNAEGVDVTAEALAAAGAKIELELVGKHEGFPLEGETIKLRSGVDPAVDELIKGRALEWMDKHREIDQDQDGFASVEELEKAGWKYDLSALQEAGYEVSAEDLAKAGMKIDLALLGEGGFATKENMVLLRFGVDDKVDALIKGEER